MRDLKFNRDGSVTIPKDLLPLVKVTFKETPRYRECKECGCEFVVTHDNQKFCPPLPELKRSRCENTYSQRVKRARKKQKEQEETK